MSISTHVLDAATGRPAAGVRLVLEAPDPADRDRWRELAARTTDADGRVADLAPEHGAGVHRLRFDVAGWAGSEAFFPEVTITFRVSDPAARHHVPLLLSPFAYSTYRGS